MKQFEKILRVAFILIYFFGNTRIPVVLAEGIPAFAGFGQENMTTAQADWALDGSSILDGVISMTALTAAATFTLDVSEIAAAIDQGGLKIRFSVDSYVADAAPEELDSASAEIGFSASGSFPGAAETLARSNSTGSEALTSSASIPTGTRFIFVRLHGDGVGESNSVSFSNPSLTINDDTNPTLSAELSPDGWTNGAVQVTLTAADAESGVEGIYDGEGNKVSSTKTYSFSTSTAGTWSFTAHDYAGHISSLCTVAVNKFDNTIPEVPSLAVNSTGWSKEAVPFTVTVTPAGEGESPVLPQYRINGGAWQNYSSGDAVDVEGVDTLEARAADEAGNISDSVSATVKIDLTGPSLSLESLPHPQPAGGATVTVTAADAGSGIARLLYAAGEHTADEFTAGLGTSVSGNSFEVSNGGFYTVYAEDAVGWSVVEKIAVNTYPVIGVITPAVLAEDGSTTVTFSVSDAETVAGNLLVSANAVNTALFTSVPVVNENGTVTLTLAPVADANGSSVITVSVSDEQGLVTTANFSQPVTAVNDSPHAEVDTSSTTEDTPIQIDVLTNDTDVDNGDSLKIVAVDDPEHGTASILNDGALLSYTPDVDWSGTEVFDYTIEDSGGLQSSASVTVTVTAVDDAPVISSVSHQAISEDTSSSAIPFTVTDVDNLSTELTVQVSSDNPDIFPADHITLTDLTGGSYTVQLSPMPNVNTTQDGTAEDSPVTITITATDGTKTSTSIFTVSVNAINDPPKLEDITTSTDEDTPIEIAVLKDATDVENETLTVIAVSSPTSGTAAITNGGSTVTYSPAANFNGTDQFTYTVRDAGGETSTATVFLTVTSVQDAPLVSNVIETIPEDSVATIPLAGNASDPDVATNEDSIRITAVTGAQHGTTEIAEDGQSFTYTPDPNWNGQEVLTYTVTDSQLNATSGTVTLTVSAVNDDPIAVDDEGSTAEDTPVTLDVLSNDTDVDQDTNADVLTILSASDPAHGTVAIIDSGKKLTYTPDPDWNGSETFTYTIEDSAHARSQAMVTMTVAAVNDAPTITSIENQTIDEDFTTSALAFSVADVDNDFSALTVTAATDNTTLFPATNIQLVNLGSGSYTLQLSPIANGNTSADGTVADAPVTVTVQVSDGEWTVPMTFTVSVTAVNDAPVVADDSAAVDEDASISIDPLANDLDIEHEALTITAVTLPSYGTATITNEGKKISYVPNSNYNGADAFQYTVADPKGATSTARISITVNSVNDAPVAKNDSVSLNEDTLTTIDALSNDTDIDISTNPGNESLTIVSVGSPSHGTAEISSNKIVYSPALNYNGTDSFTYTIEDESHAQSTATVNLTIKPVNDYPVFTNLSASYTTDEDTPLTIHFNVSDVETPTESLMLQVTSGNSSIITNSNLVLGGLGNSDSDTTLRMTPVANQNGDVVITLRLGDGFVVTVQTFTLHINPINDPPIAVNNSISFTEDTPIDIDMDSLVNNDTDIDGDTLSFVSFSAPSLQGTLTEKSAADHIYTFTPAANFDGTTTFTYTMTDGTVQRSATVSLVAIPVNDQPIITLDPTNVYSGLEDTPLTIKFTVFDYETSASALSVQAGSSDTSILAPGNISTSCTSGSCLLTATPSSNKNGTVTLTISVSDGQYLVPVTTTLTFAPVDDGPTAVADSYSLNEHATVVLSPLVNDYDVDDKEFAISALDTTGLQGILVDNHDGTLTYTAPEKFSGTDSFAYTITDSTPLSSTATVTLYVGYQDNPPALSLIDDQYIWEDHSSNAIAFTVTDPDGLTGVSVSATSSNTDLVPNDSSHVVVDGSNGNYTVLLTPLANANGTTNITVTASDGEISDSTTFLLTVYPVNDEPVVTDDSYNVNEDSYLDFNPADNDTDIESTPTVYQISSPSLGTLVRTSTGYRYTPYLNKNGTESLTYQVTDGQALKTGNITITINPVNDAPYANPVYLTVPNTVGSNASFSVLSYASDPDDVGGSVSADSIVSGPSHGTAEIVNNTITYTRTSTESNTDSFVYRVKDNGSPTMYAQATVYISDSWGPSIYAYSRSIYMNEDASKMTFTVSVGASASYGGYTLSLVNSSTLGTVNIPNVNSNTIEYTPLANANGTETLQYKVTANNDPTKFATANIYVTIYPVNDLPTITSVSDQTIDEDSSTVDLQAQISDVDDPISALKFTMYSGDQTLVSNSGIVFNNNNGTITFHVTPIPNQYGTTPITLMVSDSIGYTSTSFNLTVNSVNDPPVATDYSTSVNEDSSKTIPVIAPYTDPDGDSLILTIDTAPAHGTAEIDASQNVVYTPAANYNGTDSFVYKVDDSHGGVDTATVTISVLPVNDAPTLTNLGTLYETDEDTPKEVTFNVADVDNDLDTLEITYTSSNTDLLPLTGISLSGSGTDRILTLSPEANAYGESQVTVTVSDSDLTAQQTFRFVVDSVNDLPVAVNDSQTTNEDTSVTINVLANDTDVEDSSLTVGSVSTASHGTVTNNRDGTLTYKPNSNWNGTDSFTYTVVDHNNGQSTATVTVTVTPVNDAPNANTDSATIDEDTSVTIWPLANDSDVENDPISLVSVGSPSHGTLVNNGNNSLTYTPAADYNGTDSFTYVITDGSLNKTGTVSITIRALNDAPRLSTSADQPWTLDEDTPTSFPLHIYDPETPADNLVIRITSSNQTILPDTSISLQGTGQDKTLLLSPSLNQYGTLDIQVDATDGEKNTVVTFPVLVRSVNDLPTISNVTDQTINEDTPTAAIPFSLSDIETAGTDLTVTVASSNETLVPTENVIITKTSGGNRTVQVTPAGNRVGTATITLTVHDADGGTASDSFVVTVNSVNDAPTANKDTASVDEDDSIQIFVLANDVDPDLDNEGDDLVITSVADVNNGSVTIASDQKSLTFTPAANYNGIEVFSYTLQDKAKVESTATVTVTVNPVNDPPIANGDAAETDEDKNVTIDVLANDTDVDLTRETDDLTILSTAGVDNGTVEIAEDGKSLTFKPALNFFGEETFTYTIKDQHNAQSSASVTVKVNAVNDAPTIANIANQTTPEDTSTGTIDFLINDVDNDLDGLNLSATTSNGTVIPAGNITFGGSGSSRTISILPAADQNTWSKASSSDAPVTIVVTVSDGKLTASDSFTVSVTPVNDAPVAQGDSATTSEDNAVTISALTNDSDVDIAHEGDSISILSATDPSHGTVEIIESGTKLRYHPALNYNGSDSFTYTLTDTHNATDTATVSISISAVDDAPTIAPTNDQNVDEDQTLGPITFTIADVDNTADQLTVTVSSSNTTVIPNQTVNLSLAGTTAERTITIKPAANQNTWIPASSTYGTVNITLTVKDPDGLVATDDFAVQVNKINDPPVAVADMASVDEDSSVLINVLANDTDVDTAIEGDTISLVSTEDVTHGTAVISSGKILFTPEANYFGAAQFKYTITDLAGVTSQATVNVTVNSVDDAPTITTIANQTILEDGNTGALSFTIADIDDDASTLTMSATSSNTTILPTANIVFSGTGGSRTVTVTPAADRNTYSNGPVTVTLKVTDPGKLTAVTTFTLTVTAQNDPPVAKNDSYSVTEDIAKSLTVLSNDTDADIGNEGDTLVINSVSSVANGTLTVAGDRKSVTFTPSGNWNGTTSFTYDIKDNSGVVSNTATVSLTVTAVNDPPVAVADSASGTEDTPLVINVLSNDTDPDLVYGDNLLIYSTSGVTNGTVSVAADKKSLTFTPAANWNGSTSFTYSIRDTANVTHPSATVNVTIAAVNDTPTAVADTASTNEDNSVVISPLTNDTDPDLSHEGDVLTIASAPTANHGTIALSDDHKTFTYTPDHDWYGTDVFNYTVTDSHDATSTAAITVTVNAINDAPVISDILNQIIDEDSNTGSITFTVSDVDNSAADLTLSATTSNGSVIPQSSIVFGGSGANRTVTVTPLANKNTSGVSPVTIVVTVSDGQSANATASDSFTVTVNPLNDPPTAVADMATVAEDNNKQIDVLANDTDIDLDNEGDALTIVSTANVDHGSVSIAADGKSLTYTTEHNWNGTEVFSYTIEDQSHAQSTANVSVTVTPVNDAPTAVDDAGSGNEDHAVTVNVIENDTDPDLGKEAETDNLLVDSVSAVDAVAGSVSISADKKSVTFTPAMNWNGTTSFDYLVKDKGGLTSSATLTITIHPVNDDPVAAADLVTTDEDTPITISVLANDLDADLSFEGDTLNVVSATSPAHGTTALNAGKTAVIYTPNENWNGSDSFSYTMKDAAGRTSTATVSVTVDAVNDAPTAVADAATVAEDHSVSVSVLANDVDPDLTREGDSFSIVSVGTVPHGSVTIAADQQSLTFTPAANWNGESKFDYTMKDKDEVESTASVIITVTAVNDPPTAQADTASVDEDSFVTIAPLSNDIDVDLNQEGDDLVITTTSNPTHGNVQFTSGNKGLIYTPEANWNGEDSFTYTIRDQGGETSTAMITVTVNPQEDSPTAVDDTATVAEDGAVTISPLVNDLDDDLALFEDDLTLVSVSGVTHGTAVISTDKKSIDFTPAADWNGEVTFSYTMKDVANNTSSAQITVTVTPVNDAPHAVADETTTDEDTVVNLLVLTNDIDVDLAMEGDTQTVVSVEKPAHGVAVINSGTTITYTPDADWNGQETFQYTMEDKNHTQSSAQITVNVAAVNDAPVISAIEDQTIAEDSATGALSFTVTDVDNLPGDLLVTAQSGNGTVLPLANITLAGSGSARTVTLAPAADRNTSGVSPVMVTLTVSDGKLSDTSTFSLMVTPVNDAPQAMDDTATMDEDSTATLFPLENDTDIDLANEGDDLTIVSVASVENAKVEILKGAKSLQFTPFPDWNGENTFTYTLEDSHGVQSTATFVVTVIDMPEIIPGWQTDPSLVVKVPAGGERYKDGSSIPVKWTAFNGTGITYRLDFFDGSTWTTLATGLTGTSYTHVLGITYLHTSSARYRVLAESDSAIKFVAYSNYFVIDNRAPSGVTIKLQTSDGNPYVPGSWTHLPVTLSASGGWDLTGIQLRILAGSRQLASGTDRTSATVSDAGQQILTVVAEDPLGNQTTVGTFLVKIDVLPPAEPQLIQKSATASESSAKGGKVVLHFPEDPGQSGNSTLLLPDGSQIPIDGDYTWTAEENGEYTFIVIDNAGNQTQFIIAVTGGKVANLIVSNPVEAQPTPTLMGTIEAMVNDHSQAVSTVAGWSWAAAAKAGGGIAALLLLGLLLLLLIANVKITYVHQSNGLTRKVTVLRITLPPNDKKLKVKVSQAESYSIKLSPVLTRSLRGGSITLLTQQGTSLGSVDIPEKASGSFTAKF